MRASRIELAHDADPPIRIGLPEVAQEILDDLELAIGGALQAIGSRKQFADLG